MSEPAPSPDTPPLTPPAATPFFVIYTDAQGRDRGAVVTCAMYGASSKLNLNFAIDTPQMWHHAEHVPFGTGPNTWREVPRENVPKSEPTT